MPRLDNSDPSDSSRGVFVRKLGDPAHPSVLFVHSSGMSGGQWRRHSLVFRDAGYHVLIPDLIGCGRSAPWAGEGRFELSADVELVQDLARKRASQHGPVVLVGHSYGGAVTLKAARTLGDAVAKVVVYDPVLWGSHQEVHGRAFHEKMKARGLLDEDARGTETWMRTFVEYWGGEGAWDRLAPMAREQMMRSAPQSYDQAVALARDEEGANTYGTLGAPTLVLNGSETPKEMRESAERVAAAIPQGEHRVLQGGHMLPLTDSGLFCQTVLSWLRGTVQPV